LYPFLLSFLSTFLLSFCISIGKSLAFRLFYANFGRPDNAPYARAENAELIWPFSSGIADWQAYRFHETRVAGFGPWFSAILIVSIVLVFKISLLNKKYRWPLLLALTTVCCSVLYSRHLWWPRFATSRERLSGFLTMAKTLMTENNMKSVFVSE